MASPDEVLAAGTLLSAQGEVLGCSVQEHRDKRWMSHGHPRGFGSPMVTQAPSWGYTSFFPEVRAHRLCLG